ncbi:MAG: hypothetical protein ACFFAH_00920 [Promethearchaeota archaeon]
MELKLNLKEISAFFLKPNDFLLFKILGLEIKKIKSRAKFYNFIQIAFSMLLILNKFKKYEKILSLLKKKIHPNFDEKRKYFINLRASDLNYQNIFLEKLNKTFDNVIINFLPRIVNNSIDKRQLKYLNYLKKNKLNFFIYVPKFDYKLLLKKGINLYFSKFPNEFKIPLFWIILERMYIDCYIEVLKKFFPYLKEVYMNEESKSFSVYLSERLKNSKIKAINYSHGLTIGAPMVKFNEFYIYSKIQENFYQGTSKFKFFKEKKLNKPSYDFSKRDFAIFIVHQNILSGIKSGIFKKGYLSFIQFIEQLVNDFSFPIYIKYHPRSIETDKIFSEKIRSVKNIQDLPKNYNYLALSYSSTYVIDILEQMPFILVVPQGKDELKYYFPNEKTIFVETYKELKERIINFLDNPKFYEQYWEAIISVINNSYYN